MDVQSDNLTRKDKRSGPRSTSLLRWGLGPMSIQERDERQCWGSVQGEVLVVGVVLCSEGQVNVQGWRPRRRGVVLSSPHQLALLSQSPSR